MSCNDATRLYGHAYALMRLVAARSSISDERMRCELRREDIARSPHAAEARRLGLIDDEGLTPEGEREVAKGHPGWRGRKVNAR